MSSRSYESPLRAEQAERTRHRILDAAARVLEGGITELSVPAVAEAAGVSVATVYRHFGNKKELVRGLALRLAEQGGLPGQPLPDRLADLPDTIGRLFATMESTRGTLGVIMASELGSELRRSTLMPKRIRYFDRLIAADRPDLSAHERELLRDALLLLWSSTALHTLADRLQLDTEQAAEVVAFAMRALIRGAGGDDGDPTTG